MPANPYAAPQAKEAAITVKMLAVRRGGEVGVLADVELPPVCAKCGSSADESRSRKQLLGVGLGLAGLVSTFVFISWAALFDGPSGFGAFVPAIVALLTIRRVRWTLPLCRRCLEAWVKFDQDRFRMVPLLAFIGIGIAFAVALLPPGFPSAKWSLLIPVVIALGARRLARQRELEVTVRLRATSQTRLWFNGINDAVAAVWCQTPVTEDSATRVK